MIMPPSGAALRFHGGHAGHGDKEKYDGVRKAMRTFLQDGGMLPARRRRPREADDGMLRGKNEDASGKKEEKR